MSNTRPCIGYNCTMSRSGWSWFIRIVVCSIMFVSVLYGSAFGKWIVDENDECVRVWSPGSLLRGPIGILNAGTTPIRFTVGGVVLWIVSGQEDGASGALLEGPGIFLLMIGGGIVLVPVQVAQGIAETVTGGYFAYVDDEEAIPNVKPFIPIGDRRRGEDQCGRPRWQKLEKIEAGIYRAEQAAIRAAMDAQKAEHAAEEAETRVRDQPVNPPGH